MKKVLVFEIEGNKLKGRSLSGEVQEKEELFVLTKK
jgi:hypothetical protein